MRLTSTVIPILFATACLSGDDLADDQALSADEQAIHHGTLVGVPSNTGMVQLTNSGGGMYCSGTALTADWVLTAGHCVPTVNVDKVRLGNANDPAAQVSVIDRVVANPAMDLTLVHLGKSLDIAGQAFNWRQSMFTDSNKTLLGKRGRFYGSSIDESCTGTNCGYGFLRTAEVNIDKFGSHNLGGVALNGAAAVGGDSGGGMLFETGAGKELIGVLKCGLYDCLVRPEAFRQWAMAYIYDQPIDLPEIWNYGANAGSFAAVPVQDNYFATTTWDVCPGGQPWTYTIGYELESGYDFARITSNQPMVSYTGTGTATGTGVGPMTLDLQSDSSVRSTGIKSLQVRCTPGIRFPNPWGVPSPAGTSDARLWEPCPGGAAWKWTADYSYGAGGTGYVGSSLLTGTGTLTQTVPAGGAIGVWQITPSAGSDGMRKLTAVCDLAVHCHGSACVSTSQPYSGALRTAQTSWTPCNGGGFRYRARTEGVAVNGITITGGNFNEYYSQSGNLTGAWRTAAGTLTVKVAKGNDSSINPLKELVAQCDAWSADRTSNVQVVAATYGRNCRVNRDNVTQKVVEYCKAHPGTSCAYPVSTTTLGDPAVNCAKDFTAEWTCGTSGTVKKTVLSGEADGKTANLSCP